MSDLKELLARVEKDLKETCPPGSRSTYALIRKDDVRAVLKALIAKESGRAAGKDNCAWHLFDKPTDEPAVFYGRAA